MLAWHGGRERLTVKPPVLLGNIWNCALAMPSSGQGRTCLRAGKDLIIQDDRTKYFMTVMKMRSMKE